MGLTWSIFPAYYREFNLDQLAALVNATGLGTVNAMVREGYWVEPQSVHTELATFVHEMGSRGIAVDRASTSFSPAKLADLSTGLLSTLRDAGIREFRTGWFPKPERGIREALDFARREVAELAASCEQIGIKAVYQVHHDKLIQSPSAAYPLVKDLNPQWIGIELDPGNQSFEGYEAPDYSVDLLDEYLSWFACKDTKTWQRMPRSEEPGKGWARAFCPVFDGVINWQAHFQALARKRFRGTIVLMPFYDADDPIERTANLKKEVDYLKALAEAANLR